MVQQLNDYHGLVIRNQEIILQRYGTPKQAEEESKAIELVVLQAEAEETFDNEQPQDAPQDPVKTEEPVTARRSGRERQKRVIEDNTQRQIKKKKTKMNPPPPRPVKVRREPAERRPKIKDVDERIRAFMTLNCIHCDASDFDNFSTLFSHWRDEHDSDGHLRCCGIKFNQRYKLFRHIEVHMNPATHLCDQCPKSFSTAYSLELHRETHLPDEEKLFVCGVCNKRFFRQTKLTTHAIRQHTPMEERAHACPVCDRRFVNYSEMTAHQRKVHEKLRPFICEVCARGFGTKQTLLDHQRIHSDHPRVSCDVCGKFYSTEIQMKLHKQRQHFLEDKIFECPECGHRSKNSHALTAHINLRHKTAPNKHQCELCGKGYKIVKNLREHMASHTGERLYKCKFCELSCNSSANMYTHQKKKHPAEYEMLKMEREMKQYNRRK